MENVLSHIENTWKPLRLTNFILSDHVYPFYYSRFISFSHHHSFWACSRSSTGPRQVSTFLKTGQNRQIASTIHKNNHNLPFAVEPIPSPSFLPPVSPPSSIADWLRVATVVLLCPEASKRPLDHKKGSIFG